MTHTKRASGPEPRQPTPPSRTVRPPEADYPSAIEELSARLRARALPILHQTAGRLIDLLGAKDYEVRALSQVIFQDQAFTARLLQVANTVYYRRSDEPITTVTKALVTIGANQLRAVAISARYAELTSLPQQALVRRVIKRAFLAAHQAEALCGAVRERDSEEVFIRALLANLGELALVCELPDLYHAIEARMAADGQSRTDAYRQVIGVSLEQLTRAVGRACELPGALVAGAAKGGPSEILVALAVDVAEVLDGDDPEAAAPRIAARLAQAAEQLGRPVTVLTEAVARGLEAARLCGTALGLDAAGDAPPMESLPEPTVVRPEALLYCVQDLARHMTEPTRDVNTIINYVLEGLYRGAGFDRVALALRVPGTPRVTGRCSLGGEAWHAHLVAEQTHPTDLLAECLRTGRVVRHDNPSTLRTGLPPAVLDATHPAWVALAPLVVRRVPIGLIWASCQKSVPDQDALRWQGLCCLISQAQAGLNTLREGG